MMIEEKPAPDMGLRRLIRANVMLVVFEVIVPMALFYGLRAAGVSPRWALMAGVLVAAPYVVWTVVRDRRVDLIALVTTVAGYGALACLIVWHIWYIRKENLDA